MVERPMLSAAESPSLVGLVRAAGQPLQERLPSRASRLVIAAALATGVAFLLTSQPHEPDDMAASAPPATAMASSATARLPQVATEPREAVKIVGGKPRSANCAEQVWPYIEQRCLAGAADK